MGSIENSQGAGRNPDSVADSKPKSTLGNEIKSFFKNLVFLAVAFVFLRGTVVEAFKIPSGSMIPTLKIGDHLLVCKFSYGLRILGIRETVLRYSTPSRGNIVVFTRDDEPGSNEDESGVNIIKRVVGLPGETVEVRGTKVYINGQPLEEPYARWDQGGLLEGNFGPRTIPENHVFLLGDNRDHSRDSRFWDNPFLDIKYIKGRAWVIYWSWNDWHRIGNIIR